MKTKRRLFSDAVSNILLQFSIIVSGLILPHFIIEAYGSTINGMVASITQFLSYITLLEAGIGGVIKSQLYKPLLDKDSVAISRIVKASNGFFKKIGLIFAVYLVAIAFSFKYISKSEFDLWFVFFLVLILGISTLVQYLIGLTYQSLIQAGQHYAFTSTVQVVTIWLNVGLSVLCIKLGGSIHIVKLITAGLFAIRPICYFVYAKCKYKLTSNVEPNKDALAQRWDGFGHHIAYFIHTNTDIVLITVFLTLADVSVYSIYLMVITGIRSLISAIASAFEPYFGRLIAQNDVDDLNKKFAVYEFFYFLLSTVLFGCTLVLIIPFVSIYTVSFSDADYLQPVFAVLLVCAEFVYCLRSPYTMMVFASGHFKQTKTGAFIEAGINIFLSLLLIWPLGISGVAIGTLVAMLFRTVEYVFYLRKNILHRSTLFFFKKFFCSLVVCLALFLLSWLVGYSPSNYLLWCLYGVITFVVASILSVLLFSVVNAKEASNCISFLKDRLKRRRGTI